MQDVSRDTAPADKVRISIVSPVYQAEDCVDELVRRVSLAMEQLGERYELILVEDGSRDNSWARILYSAKQDPRVIGLRLSRNFGQHPAITAGLQTSRGEFVVVLDCDLQNPPEDIYVLYNTALKGHKVVLSRRIDRNDPFVAQFGSKVYHSVIALLSGDKTDPQIGSFCIMSQQVVKEILRLKEKHRTLLNMVRHVGFEPLVIDLPNPPRLHGTSSYSFRKKFVAAINAFIDNSPRLLYLVVGLSFLLSVSSLLALVLIVLVALFGEVGVPGWASTIAVILFVGGFLGSILGVVGLYVAKVYSEVQERPIYVVNETVNLSA